MKARLMVLGAVLTIAFFACGVAIGQYNYTCTSYGPGCVQFSCYDVGDGYCTNTYGIPTLFHYLKTTPQRVGHCYPYGSGCNQEDPNNVCYVENYLISGPEGDCAIQVCGGDITARACP